MYSTAHRFPAEPSFEITRNAEPIREIYCKHRPKLKKKKLFKDLKLTLIIALPVLLISSIFAMTPHSETNNELREASIQLAIQKAQYEQNERKIKALDDYNKIAAAKFKDSCFMNKTLKLPISPACREVLK